MSCFRKLCFPLAAVCLVTWVTTQASAQPEATEQAAPAGPPVKTGRILEKETKGRITSLKIESSEGETYDVKLTPLIDFFVVGSGDASFIKPGVYITGRGVLTNDTVFVNKVTAYLLPKTKRPPPGRVQKVAAEQGESLQSYEVSGEVTSAGPAEGYPEFTALGLKVAGRTPPVWLEAGFQVDVASADPNHVEPGQDVEMAMKPLRGGRFSVVAVRAHREAPFTTETSAAGESGEKPAESDKPSEDAKPAEGDKPSE